MLFICNGQLNVLQAQVSDAHLDLCYNLDFFTNYGALDIDKPDNGFAIRGGINWKIKKHDKLTLGFEAGFSQRSVVRRLGESKSEVRIRSIDFAPLLNWNFYGDLKAEFGLGFSFYDAALYVNSVARKLGEGFRGYDVYGTTGLFYDFHNYAGIGTRIRYGFVPALQYEPIGDYGEMPGQDAVLNQLTWEFFLRIGFYRFKNE